MLYRQSGVMDDRNRVAQAGIGVGHSGAGHFMKRRGALSHGALVVSHFQISPNTTKHFILDVIEHFVKKPHQRPFELWHDKLNSLG